VSIVAEARTKPSRSDWIGEVPEHWAVAPLYARYRVQLGKMLDEKRITGNHLASYLRNIDVQWDRVNTVDLPEMDFLPDDRIRFGLVEGDLLVCEGGEAGRTAIWRGELSECYYQKAIHRLRPRINQDFPRFFYYVMYAATKLGVFVAGGNPNTIDHLTAEKLRKHRFPFPPRNEQQAIAAFLDRKTAQIDALIGKKQRQIELLQEKRQALVSHAVTKGLDPSVPMKESGFEWLGRIPNDWETSPLGSLVKVVSGSTPSKDNQKYWDGDIPWVSPKDMKRWEIEDSEDHITSLALRSSILSLIEPHAVLIVVRGMILAREVPVAVTTTPVTINQDMKALISNNIISAYYLSHFLRSTQSAIFAIVEESGHGTRCLRSDLWKRLPIIVPPMKVQEAICDHIRAESSRIYNLAERIGSQIEKLREYRQALISAAVTGKIDVRAAVAS